MTEPINIEIRTEYDDDGANDALDDAEKLERLDPVVTVDADTSEATDGIDDVSTVAQELIDRNPWIAEVLADTGAAKSELEGLQTELHTTAEKADDTTRHMDNIGKTSGPGIGTQSISDMLGPLGDASGAASEFGQSIEGIGAIVETAAAKVGLSSAAMSTAIGGIGVAVGLAAAAWTFFKGKQEEARKKAAEHLKLQGELVDAIKDGNREVAASKFIDLYGDIIDLGHKAGLSTNEIVDAIRGSGDAAETANAKIADLDTKIADLQTTYDDLTAAAQRTGQMSDTVGTGDQLKALKEQRDALIEARDKYADLSDEQQDNVDLQDDVQGALFNTKQGLDDTATAAHNAKKKTEDLTEALGIMTGTLDVQRAAEDFDTDVNTAMANVLTGVGNTREEVRGIEDDVLAAAKFTNANPIEVATTLQKVKDGDLQGVKADVDGWYARNPVSITAVINQAKLKEQMATAQGGLQAWIDRLIPGGKSVGATSASAPQTINVMLPRGARQSDIARAMATHTRRSGRRYANPVVHHARR